MKNGFWRRKYEQSVCGGGRVMKREWDWMLENQKESEAVKCVKPLKHNPQFEGKHHCKHCERELKEEE